MITLLEQHQRQLIGLIGHRPAGGQAEAKTDDGDLIGRNSQWPIARRLIQRRVYETAHQRVKHGL